MDASAASLITTVNKGRLSLTDVFVFRLNFAQPEKKMKKFPFVNFPKCLGMSEGCLKETPVSDGSTRTGSDSRTSAFRSPTSCSSFDVSSEVARQRGGFGAERLECETLQQKVAARMKALRSENWKTVNADGTLDEVELLVRNLYQNIDRSQPLTSLDSI
ncbi:unnamed protein product [Caenorhabditis auriculariae]|uniref:Uncharacterized protein n=1 Tax=Caenorhabditis auriculariae TaxID=2777116 RepID=A0A8S1HQW8_9PELO|nr:unnamed protein product [Caenorhabditis auriculariae]